MATNNVLYMGENTYYFEIRRGSSFNGCRDDLSSASSGHPYDILWVRAVAGTQGYAKSWVLQPFLREITEIRFSFKAEISPIKCKDSFGQGYRKPCGDPEVRQ